MSIILDFKGENYLFIKGASEMVLKSCESWFNSDSGRIEDISSEIRRDIDDVITSMATDSLRTLCMGYKKLTPKDDFTHKDQKGVYETEKHGITLLAVIGVRDNPREEVPAAIKQCHIAGITVRMVTGDNIITAKAIAKEIGLLYDESFIAMEGPDFNQRVGGIVCKAC